MNKSGMRRFRKGLVGTAALGATLFGSSLALADPGTHDGFYLQLTGGLGYLSSSAEAFGTEVNYSGVSIASHIGIGGSVVPGLVIGGALIGDYAPSPGYTVNDQEGNVDFSLSLIGIGPFVDFYPDPNDGLHFQVFAGWGGLDASVDGNSGGSDPTGLVLQFGAGYEFWVGDEWSIGPMARFIYAPLSLEDVDYTTIAPALLASFTYH